MLWCITLMLALQKNHRHQTEQAGSDGELQSAAAAPASDSIRHNKNREQGMSSGHLAAGDQIGRVTNQDTLQQGMPVEATHQHSSRQSHSEQGLTPEDFPKRQASDAQTDSRASLQHSGHPQMQGGEPLRGMSSRRRSMERQSASLTLPFEQLNFVFHHINYSVPATVSIYAFLGLLNLRAWSVQTT